MTRPASGILSASLRGLTFVAVLLMGVLVPGVAGAASFPAVTAAAPDFGPMSGWPFDRID